MDEIIRDMTNKDIQKKIEEYLPVRKEEKNKYGEVFTPIELIQEMLNKLPPDVWKNPDLKWLDPANGVGNFPMVAYKKLMEGLEHWEPSDAKRSQHIIENMLYMIEINPKNVKISKEIFGSKANICCADFLNDSKKCFRQFGVDKFDIIIGNPPFQDEISKTDKTIPRKGGKNKLYERITIKCLSLLDNKGYLLFVTPDNIMTGNANKAYKEIIKYNTLYISFNNIQKRYFPSIGQSMCYFLVQVSNKNDNLETTINNNIDHSFKLILENRPINPISDWTLNTEKIVRDYISSNRNEAVYNRGTNKSSYNIGKYTVVYTPEQMLYTNNHKLASGIGIKKIILFEYKPFAIPFIDNTGKYGVGPHTFYIPFKKNTEGKLMERFFKSNIYKTLVKVSITSQYLKTSLVSYLNINKILLEI